jgi:D-alanyl-D-alanine carboxypeptidase
VGAAQIPGLEVGIWIPRRGRLVQALGTSDRATGTPLSLDDHFRIASVTKAFIATTVLRLVEQRRIRLSDTLNTFIAGITNGERITIAELLNMTSGMFDYVTDPTLNARETADPLLPFSLDNVLAIIKNHSPVFAPGTQVMYDNSNYYLLGSIIGRVTRRPLPAVVKRLVLDPLGLHHTSYPVRPDLPAPYSHGYLSRANLDPRDVTASNPAFAGGAGAMISTLADLKIWARALATGVLLMPATHAAQLKTRLLLRTAKISLGYGMGIMNLNGFLGHDGAIVGYGSFVFYLPSKRATIVVLGNNNDNGNPAPLPIGLALAAYLFPEHFPNGL